MANIDVKNIYKVKVKGRTYIYAWKGRGAPRIYAEEGTREFIEELNVAWAELRAGSKTKIDGLVIAYRSSKDFIDLRESTKRNWNRWLDRIRDEFGSTSIRAFERPLIVEEIEDWRDNWKDQPRSADYAIQVLSKVLSFGVKKKMLGSNPCSEIEKVYSSDRSDIIWTPADLAAFKKHATPEVYKVVMLGALTGLRLADVLELRWDEIDKVAIERVTNKSISKRRRSKPKTAVIPLYKELKMFLADCPRKAETVLTTSRGTPWEGWGSGFNEAMHDAGLSGRLHFHDLRGTFATKLYLANIPERDIAGMLGWTEERVQKIITRYVNREKILRDKAKRMNAGLKAIA